jgi:hypothetical protein
MLTCTSCRGQGCAGSTPTFRAQISASAPFLQDALGQQHAEEQQQHHITLDKEFGVYSTRKPKQWWEFLQHQGKALLYLVCLLQEATAVHIMYQQL